MALTPKQNKFANAIIAGASPVEAYREAGYSQRMSKAAQAVAAQKLLHHPNISVMIEEGKTEAARMAVWSREKAIERLQAVNDAAYTRIMNKGAESRLERAEALTFMESLDRLNGLCNVAAESVDAAPVIVFDKEAAEAARKAGAVTVGISIPEKVIEE